MFFPEMLQHIMCKRKITQTSQVNIKSSIIFLNNFFLLHSYHRLRFFFILEQPQVFKFIVYAYAYMYICMVYNIRSYIYFQTLGIESSNI